MAKPVKASLINTTLVIAYAGYDYKRVRDIKTPEYWKEQYHHLSYEDTPYADMISPNPEVPNGESLPGIAADSSRPEQPQQ
jgi:hypothetical protein